MELLGKLSFGLNEEQVDTFAASFEQTFGVDLLPLPEAMCVPPISDALWQICIPFIKRKMALSDALVLAAAEDDPDVGVFLTWNARHFTGKTRLQVLTPKEYLATVFPTP